MAGKKLPAITDWIKESLQIYFKRENLIYLTKFALLQLLLTGLLFLGMFLLFGTSDFASFENADGPSFDEILTFLPAIVIGLLVFLILNLWLAAATLNAVAQVVGGKILGVKETLKIGARRMFVYLILSVLTSLIVIFGMVLLIIPGLIFIVWFYFAQFYVLVEGLGPIESLKKSRNIVRGNFWPISGRIVVSMVYALTI